MPSSFLKSKLAATVLLATMLAQTTAAAPQKLAKRYVGVDFETEFDFFDDADPTNGFVNYVSKTTAKQMKLVESSSNYFKMKVDDTTPTASGRGRSAIRIVSKDEYADGVYVLDVDHMPVGCGTWPAWWTTTRNNWPKGGEIDIIEGSNAWPAEGSSAWVSTFTNGRPNVSAAPLQTNEDTASLHTIPSCNVEQQGQQTGHQASTICDAMQNDNQGCGVELGNGTWGASWNADNGGYYVLHRDFSKTRTISVYTFPRTATNTPSELSDLSSATLDPSSWGITPQAHFTIPQCKEETFNNHVIVFNIALCGDLAGNTFAGNGCPGTCNDFVANNPGAFSDAWWGIRSMRVYNASGTVTEERMRPWVAALISLVSIAVAVFGTVGLLYYVYRKRRGHNHNQHVELLDAESMASGGKGDEYLDDPEHEGGRQASSQGPFTDVAVDDNASGADNRLSVAGSNRLSTVGNRHSQVVGSRRSTAAHSNRNSTIDGNRRSQYDDNRVSMFSFSAPPSRMSAYSSVGAATANANRNSRVFVDPRVNQGPLKVGDGGTVPRAPGELMPGETPAVNSMKQYNTLNVNQSATSSGRLSKARGQSPSTSAQASRRGSLQTSGTSGGQTSFAPSSAAATPRSARRARVNTNQSNRSSMVSDTPTNASAQMDRKPSWDSQVGQKLSGNRGRRPSTDQGTLAAAANAGASGWGSDEDK